MSHFDFFLNKILWLCLWSQTWEIRLSSTGHCRRDNFPFPDKLHFSLAGFDAVCLFVHPGGDNGVCFCSGSYELRIGSKPSGFCSDLVAEGDPSAVLLTALAGGFILESCSNPGEGGRSVTSHHCSGAAEGSGMRVLHTSAGWAEGDAPRGANEGLPCEPSLTPFSRPAPAHTLPAQQVQAALPNAGWQLLPPAPQGKAVAQADEI